ncbi:hypothetical protein [Petropleomorpha daqingensis]|uniref:Uncharacterized protein n=1 Tax=Petropleomorpha daqingensis TaxID=2026353 RepID=A0A853CG67_9ACTN|nr:hypothetical protein [Petropleomorpha daqingensis]NYJ06955.1 hypothetical protein [Petropleomorpha daqingensis]
MRSLTDRHPADGTLRRLVDEPAGVSDADRAHVAGCAACLAGLAAAQRDAAAVASALRTDAAPDVDAAWRRFSAASAPVRSAVPAAPRRRRVALRSPVVAALGVVLILGGAGAAAAADWLQIFRTEQVAAVPVTEAELVALPDLSAYGDLKVIAQPDVHDVDGLAAAREATGLDVPLVEQLPAGVTGNPSFTVGGQLVAEFTFSAAKAAQAAGNAPPPPAGLDGATFRLQAGPGIAETWSEGHGVPALVVARVVAPTAYSTGVPFATARDYLLSLPGLPDSLADQLRTFTADGSTLPLPVPAQLVTSSTADVNGTTATVLASRDGAFTGVVWVEDGVVTGVAGSLSEDEVLAVARGLR